jgi:Small subunit of serine palmitoyltransferase-like
MESQTSSAPRATSFLTRTKKKLQLMYYQYSVTLPLYGMQRTERAIFNSLVILSIFFTIQLSFYMARLGVRVLWVLVGKVGGA